MNQACGILIIGLISILPARAETGTVEATMMTEPGGREITAYVSDAPKLYAIFKTKGVKEGDKLRSVWIADDVGEAAPGETKIDEKTITAKGEMDGEFSLSKPTQGWRLGKYHIEIFVNNDLATKVKFEIKAANNSKKSSKEQEEDEEE